MTIFKADSIIEYRIIGYEEEHEVTKDFNVNNFEFMRTCIDDYSDNISVIEKPLLVYACDDFMKIFIDRIFMGRIMAMSVEDFNNK